jgi:peptidyl-prolyl cis-trans isomerase D
MFSADLGDVYGPYFEDNAYKLAKLAKINFLPDSVKVSHIYLPATQANVQQTRLLADSLVKIARKGHSFTDLVQQNTRDMNTVMQDGDLGWIKEGTKGPAFSDSCFFSEKGDVKLTFSQEGFHVIKITDMSRRVKKVQVGVLTREVVPGNETDQKYYKQAIDFLNQNRTLEKFEQSVADNDPLAIPVYGINPLDREIQGLGNARNIIHWAFEEAEEGEVYDDVDNYQGQYVVAVVTKVNNEGYIPLKDIKETIEIEIVKQKKAKKLSDEFLLAMANSQSIDDVAKELELQVKSATGIRFTSYSVMDAGTEPKLIGAAISAEPDELAGPIEGENGVYVFSVDSKNEMTDSSSDLKLTQNYIERGYAARVNRLAFETLQDLANIEDHRGRFF